jgi:hypothetical protein
MAGLDLTATKQKFLANGSGKWTTLVNLTAPDDEGDGAWYSALARPQVRTELLDDSSWDLTMGSGLPGFSK